MNHLARNRPTGPQAPPARVAASLVGALRAARGALPWTAGASPTVSPPLTREIISTKHKPSVVFAEASMLGASPGVITIAGIRDHHRLEPLITIPGMRRKLAQHSASGRKFHSGRHLHGSGTRSRTSGASGRNCQILFTC